MTAEQSEHTSPNDAQSLPDAAVAVAEEARPHDGSASSPGADDGGAFQLALPIFQGPLDLLLHLIEREELDITNIALVQVADQYLEYIRSSEQINLDALADFIYIGARLLLLKSRALLPRPKTEQELLSEYEDPSDDLARQLREYKLFKEAAGQLRSIEQAGLHSYPRIAPPPELPPPLGLDGITLDLLRGLVEQALTRVPEEEPQPIIRPHRITVRDKVAHIREQLLERGRVSFRALMLECQTRMEIIVSFMAVLELIKARVLDALQDAAFADIVLVPVEDEEAVAGPVAQ
jgi:segregation and condensation protein A